MGGNCSRHLMLENLTRHLSGRKRNFAISSWLIQDLQQVKPGTSHRTWLLSSSVAQVQKLTTFLLMRSQYAMITTGPGRSELGWDTGRGVNVGDWEMGKFSTGHLRKLRIGKWDFERNIELGNGIYTLPPPPLKTLLQEHSVVLTVAQWHHSTEVNTRKAE